MRPHPRDPDALGPVPFTLAAAVATGLVRSLGEIVQPRGVAVLGIAVLSFAAMALILWLGIRRQWEPVWSTALQLTVAWTVADLLAFPVAIAVAVPNVHAFPWRDAAINVGSAQLGMALVRFPITLGLVAAGRHFLRLHQTRTAVAASDLAAHGDPVGLHRTPVDLRKSPPRVIIGRPRSSARRPTQSRSEPWHFNPMMDEG